MMESSFQTFTNFTFKDYFIVISLQNNQLYRIDVYNKNYELYAYAEDINYIILHTTIQYLLPIQL